VIGSVRIAVVVPARNEQRWLGEVLDTMPPFVDTVVVVDDGSCDSTAAVATERARSEVLPTAPPVVLIRHRERRGVGAAIASGYRAAHRSAADVIAVMAGDGQMHPEDLAAIVGPIVDGAADYVKGNRLAHPQVSTVMPIVRRVGTRLLSSLTGLATGVSVTDSQCGFTAISSPALARIDLEGMWKGFGYPNDLIGTLARSGARIEEVVVRPVYRGERSALRPWHTVTISYVLARVAWRRWVHSRSAPRGRQRSAADDESSTGGGVVNASPGTRPWPRDGSGCPKRSEIRRVLDEAPWPGPPVEPP